MRRAVVLLAAGVALAVSAESATAGKIAAKCRVTARDRWHGGERTVFELNGCETWVVEPEKPAAGNPWAWIMEWPGAFAKRTGAPALIAAGYRVVTFRPGFYKEGAFVSRPGNMNDRRLVESRAFQTFVVEELGLAPKANLIGMSWGGFYSIRYASTYPDCVARIYLDAPLLDFTTLAGYSQGGWGLADTYKIDCRTYVGRDDPRQPVNRAEPIAKAGIPILLLYGGADAVVPPGPNCERFAAAFKAFGGTIRIQKRGGYGHHPHGLEVDEQQQFVDFFNGK
ncbi:MAG: alpha/beta hydrolase [Kiritimatiellia bacterium]